MGDCGYDDVTDIWVVGRRGGGFGWSYGVSTTTGFLFGRFRGCAGPTCQTSFGRWGRSLSCREERLILVEADNAL